MPDNATYYYTAYTIAVAVYALYAVALLRRRARVREALKHESAGRV